MTIDKLIDRLEELEGKATHGDWVYRKYTNCETDCGDVICEEGSGCQHLICSPTIFGFDGKFIAETRNALPLLIKAIRIYREALETISEEWSEKNSGRFAKQALKQADEEGE